MHRTYIALFLALILLASSDCLGTQTSDNIKEARAVSDEQNYSNWQAISSVEDFYAAYPEKMDFIFRNLDLEREGLQKVKQAYETGNLVAAGNSLLDYYRKSDMKGLVSGDEPSVSGRTVPAADSIVRDIITIQGVSDRVPRLENGHLDWHHTGPEDDMEYAWLHNRHSTVRTLLDAWLETGNPKYARHIDKYIKDWIISSWPYPGVKSSTAMWRGLEVTGRVRNWMPAFYNLLDTGYLSPATQLFILSSLPEHTHYLRNFHAQGNWLTMEISGLSTVAAYFPEFKEASDWLEYSIGTMTESMKEQVYPDGVQAELTSHYHRVAMRNFSQFREICNTAGISLPDFYTRTLEDMWNYLAVSMRPDGNGVLNNDSDLTYNREIINEAALEYNRADWQYIASNGQSGIKPEKGPSFVFPWAGQMISRSDYGRDAHWSFFDIGPWGIGHQHNDKLHLSVAAFGRDLLVDAGRFAYRGKVADKFRAYANSSRGHNLLLVDGKGQGPGPRLADEPIPEVHYKIAEKFDYASASFPFDRFNELEGDGRHTRSLFYVRGEFWIVVDHISTDRPRTVEALWHWHPEILVQKSSDGAVATNNQRGNLKIIPVGNTDWSIDMIKGQEDPEIQGWYSREYNTYEPNTTTIYSGRIKSDDAFVWVLFPSDGVAPEVNTEVLSQNSEGVNVSVAVPGKGHWEISVPFSNSAEANMEFVGDEH